MKYINKDILRADFDAYTIKYLLDTQQEDGTFVPILDSTASYDGFSKKLYKFSPIPEGTTYNGWLSVLLEEQEYRCCYCMCRLSPEETSVEHLVPERFNCLNKSDEYNYYSDLSVEIRDHVMIGEEFDKLACKSHIDCHKIQRMPHLIAHSNLFPTCQVNKAGCSCNSNRGNKRILPLMLLRDIELYVTYTPDGTFQLHHTDVQMSVNTLKALDINTPELKRIRHLWYLCSRQHIHPTHTPSFDERDKMLKKYSRPQTSYHQNIRSISQTIIFGVTSLDITGSSSITLTNTH